jgi:hypothetical protein
VDLRRPEVGSGPGVLWDGLRGGAILGVVAIALGVAGLSPSLSWIPEVLLLAAFVALPTGIVAAIGYRTGSRTKRVRAGVFAAAIAGAIGGCVGGLTYVAFGKPITNVLVGIVAGAVGGGIVGCAGALLSARRKTI